MLLGIAINRNYHTGKLKSTVHYKYGKIDARHVVFTGEAATASGGGEKELKGYYPTVESGRVLAIFEQLSPLRKVLGQCGAIEKPGQGVQWRGAAADSIDNGHRPSVSLTDSGEFMEIHESHLPVVDQSMFYRIGQLQY